jgi:subtilisin family serine protease
MVAPEHDPHLRPDHHYPRMPDGLRICDDEIAAGDYFLYRDRQLIVRSGDVPRVQTSLRDFDYAERDHYRLTPSLADPSLTLLTFNDDIPVDTIDVFRRLRYLDFEEEPGPSPHPGGADEGHDAAEGQRTVGRLSVWPNHVLALQAHTKWGAGALPRPRDPLPALPGVPDDGNLPGSGVRVGVLDTGIEQKQSWLTGHWKAAAGRSHDEVAEYLGDQPTLRYSAGHGSFVIGTVLQHAPGATIIVDRFDDSLGCIDDWRLHERLSALLDRANRLDVLNLSLGGYTVDNRPMPGVCGILDRALDANPELVVVASAGNDGLDRFMWPAALSRVVGVGAIGAAAPGDDHPHRWRDSNFGAWVSAWTLGEDLASTFVYWPAGSEQPSGGYLDTGPMEPVSAPTGPERFDGWAIWTGTSFAAARVSGAIAAELGRDSRSPRQVVFDLVRNTALRFESGGLVEPATFVVPATE